MVATPATLVSFLDSIAGSHTISGQFIECNDQTDGFADIATIQANTGKWLGMIGIDFFHYNVTGPAVLDAVPEAIAYFKAGGLVVLQCHMPNPAPGGGGVADVKTKVSPTDIIKKGTATNTNYNNMLTGIGKGILQMEAGGLTALPFRILHEGQGGWFWWGSTNFNPAQYVSLFEYTIAFLVAMGCKSLIPYLALNGGFASLPKKGAEYLSPLVKMFGFDNYSSNPGDTADYNAALAFNMPVCYAEFGAGSPSAGDKTFNMNTLINTISSSMPKIVLWQNWWNPWGMANTSSWADVKSALSQSRVYNRGDLSLTAAPPVVTPPASFTPSPDNTVILKGSTATITGADGTKWGLSPTGVVTVNGTADGTTADVVELDYVKGVIWQKSTLVSPAGLYWGATSATSGWNAGPAAGTATSPLPPPPPPPPVTQASVLAEVDAITAGVVSGQTPAALEALLATLRANITKLP